MRNKTPQPNKSNKPNYHATVGKPLGCDENKDYGELLKRQGTRMRPLYFIYPPSLHEVMVQFTCEKGVSGNSSPNCLARNLTGSLKVFGCNMNLFGTKIINTETYAWTLNKSRGWGCQISWQLMDFEMCTNLVHWAAACSSACIKFLDGWFFERRKVHG